MGRDERAPARVRARDISIHAPRMGRDTFAASYKIQKNISIHAPRMGRDRAFKFRKEFLNIFQSTRPVWGATLTN